MYALMKDLVYSQQLAKIGWVKGVGVATRSKPRYNLTGDPYFTAGLRAVLMFDRRPHSFKVFIFLVRNRVKPDHHFINQCSKTRYILAPFGCSIKAPIMY
jgi:hypothetical protein